MTEEREKMSNNIKIQRQRFKTCDGCKACIDSSKTNSCCLNFKQRIKNLRINGVFIVCPSEKCPKPRTMKKFIELSIKEKLC